MLNKFSLNNRVSVITGGAGLLGQQHAVAIAELGGVPILWDVDANKLDEAVTALHAQGFSHAQGEIVDITCKQSIENSANKLISRFGQIDILINNAARDPKVTPDSDLSLNRFENFSVDAWLADLNVGLTGALFCCQIIGTQMANKGHGNIINIASDLGIIAPDQRLYRDETLPEHQQPVKPVSYSIIKHGLIGLTKYIATYWATQGVRCNALAPAGVYNQQPEKFVQRIAQLIPMERMAEIDEYQGAIQFLASDASSYMNGSVLTIDGGRTCW